MSSGPKKSWHRNLIWIKALLSGGLLYWMIQRAELDELSTEDYDSMADRLVDAALDGDFRAIQKIAEAIDE